MSAIQNMSALLDDDPARQTLAKRATSAVCDVGNMVDTLLALTSALQALAAALAAWVSLQHVVYL
jgi:hypothetical protein